LIREKGNRVREREREKDKQTASKKSRRTEGERKEAHTAKRREIDNRKIKTPNRGTERR
jgi:hypothetical protein